ncbi:MAG: hypothetical protein WCI02_07165 [Planctomycetota bacterium]
MRSRDRNLSKESLQSLTPFASPGGGGFSLLVASVATRRLLQTPGASHGNIAVSLQVRSDPFLGYRSWMALTCSSRRLIHLGRLG